MVEPLRVFIGSSSEALLRAQDLQELLFQEGGHGIQSKGWWSSGVFQVGETFIESLERVMKDTNAAILVATEDDQTTIRGEMKTQPRDNITFECGMAISAHGRKRTALAVLGQPKLPTDLDGVNHLSLEAGRDGEDFKERNRVKIRGLIQQWRGTDIGKADPPQATNVQDMKLTDSVLPGGPSKVPGWDDIATTDKEDALVIVKEIKNYHDDLLSKTNLVRRYKVNRIAVSALRQDMNSGQQRYIISQPEHSAACHLVTVDEYKAFEKKSRWRCLGYGIQSVFEAEDGTKAISGVTETESEQMKREIPADPFSAIVIDSSPNSKAVRGVSWYDAVSYCRFVGGRLPTKEELAGLSADQRSQDIWEWTQTWLDEETAHIAVFRHNQGRDELIGVNPDLRLRQLGFRVIL